MRPYCAHQKSLGWDKLATKKVIIYHYTMTKEALNQKKEAEKAALEALKNGKSFIPTAEQIEYANLSYSKTSYKEISDNRYEPKKSLYAGDKNSTEEKTLGWLHPEEHPDGILCKPCPICGYKYGTAWKKEEIPAEVIDWLFHLPDSPVRPAWI